MKSYFMGVDVSKGYADFMITDSKKRPSIKGFQLDDTFEGHRSFYNILSRFFASHPDSRLFIGMESTGGYENNWYNKLLAFQGSLDIQTARLNPLGVMHNSKADLKKNTTDKLSAQNIAEYLVAHPEKVTYQQQDSMAGLRRQWKFIKMLTKQCTQFFNQLNMLIYIACPELLQYCHDGVPSWVLKLIVRYPSADRLKRARVKTIAKIPYVSIKRAQKLISAANHSVASATDVTTEQLIIATARQIIHLRGIIDEQTKRMINNCSLREVELLKTFIGIGDKSAIGLFIEIQTIERFENAKKLASFFGVHPVYKESGDGVGGFKMSKQGRTEPRHILYMITLNAIQNNPLIKQCYEEQLKKGKHSMSAMGICMHKILRIVYGMLKHNKPFDPKIDIANRQRSALKQTDRSEKNPSRRFQEFDPKAPVSGRQWKKRLEQDRPQSASGTKSGITEPVPLKDIIANLIPNL